MDYKLLADEILTKFLNPDSETAFKEIYAGIGNNYLM
jgi:hypothetical protein